MGRLNLTCSGVLGTDLEDLGKGYSAAGGSPGSGPGTEVLRCEQRLCRSWNQVATGCAKFRTGALHIDNWKAQIGRFDIKQGCDGRVFSFF